MKRRCRTGGSAIALLTAVAAMVLMPIGAGLAGASPVARTTSTPRVAASPAAGLVRPRTPGVSAAAAANTVGMMTYHGGSVMHHVTVYAVYWQPPGTFMSPNYKTLINRWFTDIGNSSSYNVVQQYGDGAGGPGLDVTFGGAWTDTGAFPNGEGSKSNPVTDNDLLNNAVPDALNANPSWVEDANHLIFVYLPKGTYLGSGSSMSFVDFCAFHFAYQLAGETIYAHPVAAMPYVGTNPGACDALNNGSPVAPNGDADADSEINTSSHELFEAVSDPAFDGVKDTGWYYLDSSHEIGDQCNFVFGPLDTQGGNVVLNGHEYVIQAEWSNSAANPANPTSANGCVVQSRLAASVAVTSSGNPSGPGQPVTFTATVTPAVATRATGTAKFLDGSTTLAPAVPVVSGVATYTPTSLASGSHSVTAVYSGDANYTAATSAALVQTVYPPLFVYPTDGQTNVDTTVAFSWTAPPGTQAIALGVGTTLYGTDLVNSGILPAGQTSFIVPALPVGQTLYALLWVEVNGAWSFQSITFTAAPGLASFIHPTNGQNGVDVTSPFTWSTIPHAQAYYLVVGTAPSGFDLVNSGVLPSSQSSFSVPALPAGRPVYATLLTEVNGTWSRYQSVSFTAAPAAATVTYPLNAQVGVDTTKPFAWAPIAGVQGYYLVIGTSQYGYDLVNSGVIAPGQTSYNLPALPTGQTLYATLFTAAYGVWNPRSITFTAAPGVATFTYPANGQTGGGTTKPFSWTTIAGAQGYYLAVGTTQYGYDVVNSGVLPPGQSSLAMPSLPAGRVLYATLFTEVNGNWNRLQSITFTT